MYIDESWARAHLPLRENSGNKGSFGKLFAIVGSARYRGAARLSLLSALRGGAGYVYLCAEESVCRELSMGLPEIIYEPIVSGFTDESISAIVASSGKASAVLVGCGSGASHGLFELCRALIGTEGGTLILDADAINSIAEYSSDPIALLASAKRRVILTPHPLEFSRISGIPTEAVNESREATARDFAGKTGTVLLLKGYGTVISDGTEVYVNTSGSSALAKAGSGDTLAGLLASIAAMGKTDALTAAALAAFIHGTAGERLAAEYSTYGVTPSDLPREMARVIASLQNSN
ncbi:MAG: NAD(P)H-hydrate dehydratase [Clostridia bacterium]|nr:NAD(P)H-hydrate dehydratase [Clostridia bacterium]